MIPLEKYNATVCAIILHPMIMLDVNNDLSHATGECEKYQIEHYRMKIMLHWVQSLDKTVINEG